MLTLRCKGQQAIIAVQEKVATDFISVNAVKFEFCERWNGMDKVAQFTQTVGEESKTYSVDIDELTNTAAMPNEVVAGELLISAFGVHPTTGVRITTIPAKITVEKSGFVGDGETPIPPTPDLYTQFVAKLSTLAKVPVPTEADYQLVTDANSNPKWERKQILYGKNGQASVRGRYAAKEDDTYSMGNAAVAFGYGTKAPAFQSSAFGNYSEANGSSAFAAGTYCKANGAYSFVAGDHSEARGDYSVAMGERVRAYGEAQYVFGKNNEWDTDGRYAHIVGNGTDSNNRSNAHTLDWDGNAWFAGDVYVGGKNQDKGERLARMSDLAGLGGGAANIYIAIPEDEMNSENITVRAFSDEAMSVQLTYAEGKARIMAGAGICMFSEGNLVRLTPLLSSHNDDMKNGFAVCLFGPGMIASIVLVYADSVLD